MLACDGDAYVLGCRLRVEVEITSTGQWLWAEYDDMTIESEVNNYTLHVTGYHGNAGDAFNDDHHERGRSNGMPFGTLDVENDQKPNGNCAVVAGCGWWYKSCSRSLLNCEARWFSKPRPTGTKSDGISVSTSRMLLRCGAG